MTREEQIKKAAFEYADVELVGIIDFKKEAVFIEGAKWADTHPHWISVKDRKPKLKHSEDNFKYSDTVIVTNGKYRTSARWLHYTLGGWYGWYDDGDEELKGITYWMPMPEPPKEGGEE